VCVKFVCDSLVCRMINAAVDCFEPDVLVSTNKHRLIVMYCFGSADDIAASSDDEEDDEDYDPDNDEYWKKV